MGFGPVYPHTKFHTVSTKVSSDLDPYQVARNFVTTLVKDQPSGYMFFSLRKDSYTDKTTGVTHVFFRQLIRDIQVLDGDINVNVKNGAVIPYGDSSYRGSLPNVSFIDEPTTPSPHAEFCERLLEEVILSRQEFVATDHWQVTSMSGFLPEDRGVLYRRKCKHIRAYYEIVAMSSADLDDVADPRNALFQLMVATTSHDTVGLDILNDHDQIRGNMTSQIEPQFTGENYGSLVKMIDNVPDAVSPVKAKPVYFQLPDGDETVLVQAWLFEVEMQHNWYEAVVSRHVPYRILSIVDWVK